MGKKRFVLAWLLVFALIIISGCTSQNDVPAVPEKQDTVSTAEKLPEPEAEEQEIANPAPVPQLLNENPDSDPASEEKRGTVPIASVITKPEQDALSSGIDKGQVRLVATSNYGEQVIFDRWVDLEKKCSALELSDMYLDIETAYGGSFVNGINGLKSGYTGNKAGKKNKQDWFLFINGCLLSSGANDAEVKNGDVVWWDYHEWGTIAFTPAMIGAFPQPFSQEAAIYYSPSAQDYAEKLAEQLKAKGAEQVKVNEYDDQVIIQRNIPSLVIGLWSELAEYPAIKSMNENCRKTGVFCKFQATAFLPLTKDMKATDFAFAEGSACLTATGSGLGDTNSLWLIIAYDDQGLEKAVELLAQGNIDYKCSWGLMISQDRYYRLPVK